MSKFKYVVDPVKVSKKGQVKLLALEMHKFFMYNLGGLKMNRV
jgi:hypothetical protein